MANHMVLFLVTLPILALGDLLWVGFIASNFYNKYIGHLRGDIEWLGAILFYLVYTLGITVFVVEPYTDSLEKTAAYGALLGLVTYGVYNFTNHAVLNNWPLTVVAVDIVWGVCLTTFVSVSAYYIFKIIF